MLFRRPFLFMIKYVINEVTEFQSGIAYLFAETQFEFFQHVFCHLIEVILSVCHPHSSRAQVSSSELGHDSAIA